MALGATTSREKKYECLYLFDKKKNNAEVIINCHFIHLINVQPFSLGLPNECFTPDQYARVCACMCVVCNKRMKYYWHNTFLWNWIHININSTLLSEGVIQSIRPCHFLASANVFWLWALARRRRWGSIERLRKIKGNATTTAWQTVSCAVIHLKRVLHRFNISLL